MGRLQEKGPICGCQACRCQSVCGALPVCPCQSSLPVRRLRSGRHKSAAVTFRERGSSTPFSVRLAGCSWIVNRGRDIPLCWLWSRRPSWLASRRAVAPIPPLNQKVLEFTRERIGKKVDDGQCISLAVEALRFAGAKRYPFDLSGDYVWGRPIASFKEALPGDILQFRNAVFQGKRWITKRRWVSWHYEYPHHTAIVSEVREGGRVVAILHQNVGAHDDDDAKKQVVQEASIRPESLQAGGSVAIFRPIARDEGK